jgi:hypothetical protein
MSTGRDEKKGITEFAPGASMIFWFEGMFFLVGLG